MGHSVCVTRGIRVEVGSRYLAERSQPTQNFYFFTYRITIGNESAGSVQLISRHWIITDGEGRVEHVRGPGVVGKKPRLEPGESFEYSSFCPLTTPRGSMRGSYQMHDEEGRPFEVEIAPFTLEMPLALN
ncbi:MAG: Co2+/Mg2+ efflux protein ApaG [Acidobacteriota bacterium]|nr:Co2+/Mg2+ efflux protein ApaG [Acidobacteriota bacterium]MDQ7088362.1 Co2+/Mg2+ efflux protein ApaG [Acidobacteriota bacterium]